LRGAMASSAAIANILAAKSHWATLQLTKDATAEELRKQYRRLALLVHPDKCSEIPEAKAAFQKLSEAFEQLQPAASHPATGEKNKLKRKREKPWWDVPTWEEFERKFREQNVPRAPQTDGDLKMQSLRELNEQISEAQKALEHYAGRRFTAPSTCQDLLEARGKLMELLSQLRRQHRYCVYCGCSFQSDVDLTTNCPGITKEEHEATRCRQSDSTELVEVEADPLDAFMSNMEDELTKDLRKSYQATKNRHMPQKGWSFQQQAQQNKNEMKRLGGRR